MSITFHLNIEDTDLTGFEVKDWETEKTHMFPNYDAAVKGWTELGANPSEWSISPCYNISDEFDVNMANGNASDVLKALGLRTDDENEDWYAGDVEPDDLIGRCLIVLAVGQDQAVPASREVGQNGAVLINVGRDASYVKDKCEALIRLAEHAKQNGRTIVWN